jgi:hypothetical protein
LVTKYQCILLLFFWLFICLFLFFQAEGLRIIEQLLCSRGSLIEDRIEAAGVLAQITSPWISDNHKINHLDNFVYNMVNALTGNIYSLQTKPQRASNASFIIIYNCALEVQALKVTILGNFFYFELSLHKMCNFWHISAC